MSFISVNEHTQKLKPKTIWGVETVKFYCFCFQLLLICHASKSDSACLLLKFFAFVSNSGHNSRKYGFAKATESFPILRYKSRILT